MKLWLDDQRPAPDESWHRVWTVDEAIECLNKRVYSEVSLDHDLGNDDEAGTGYTVLCWLEERVMTDATFPAPKVYIHTDNAAAINKMKQGAMKIEHVRQQRRGG